MIFDIARRRADLTPDHPAVLWQDRWLDYAELDQRARRLAALLAGRGVRFGERVSILAHNHLAHLDLILATAKLGFVYAPLNTRLAAQEQAAIGAYLRPSVVLHDEAHRGQAESALAGANGALAKGDAALAGADPVAARDAQLLGLNSYEAELSAAPDEHLPAPELDDESIQMILLTGGTTGLPKGAMISYRQGFYNVVNTVLSWGLQPGDCVVQATPAFHAAVNALTVPLLHLGARVVMQPTFNPGDYLRLVEESRATALFLVPTMYRMLTEHASFASADLSSVRWAISGGAACPEPVREAFAARGIRFRQGYGLSEAGVNCFAISLDQAAERPDSVGKPMLHAQAAVRGPGGEEQPPGEVGELTLAGPHLFSGYFERPEETTTALQDGWLWTGDLASKDRDGFYTIVGRRKEMYVSGGENVYPSEVENALYDHPAVAECAVLGVPDERWGEVGLAAVVLHDGVDASEPQMQTQLREHLRARLAGYKLPKSLWLLNELPKSAAGKILKGELAERYAAEGRA